MTREHLNEHGDEKRSWPTFVQAQRFADALPIVDAHAKPGMTAYLCTECARWHVGTNLTPTGVLRVEIGQRAYAAIMGENSTRKGPSSRRWHVTRRAREAVARRKVAA